MRRPTQVPSSKQNLETPFGALSRRAFVVGLPLFAAGCVSGGGYGAVSDGGFVIPAIDLTTIDSDLTRQSVAWKGKEKWPHWTPTANMIAAIPMYRAYAGGINGGIDNPLGARALYLYRNGRDTHFRLHGTTEPQSIGQAVSSGCIRLFNQDIIDLYERVPIGTQVTVVS